MYEVFCARIAFVNYTDSAISFGFISDFPGKLAALWFEWWNAVRARRRCYSFSAGLKDDSALLRHEIAFCLGQMQVLWYRMWSVQVNLPVCLFSWYDAEYSFVHDVRGFDLTWYLVAMKLPSCLFKASVWLQYLDPLHRGFTSCCSHDSSDLSVRFSLHLHLQKLGIWERMPIYFQNMDMYKVS